MTKRRNDSHSTEFGLWLREQREIDSKDGYLATNIDFMWSNYKTKKWMILEEKRYMSTPKRWQHGLFQILHTVCRLDPNYQGLHLIQFEKTGPEDGKIYVNKNEVTKKELIEFLQFKRKL